VKQTNPASWAAKAFALVALTFASGWGGALQGQTNLYTPEGTEIVNVATATFTDAAGNVYDEVESNESVVTVGFLAEIDVTAEPVDLGSLPANTENQRADFLICLNGNAEDDYVIVTSGTATDGLIITGYEYDGIVYEDLVALNAALALVELDAYAADDGNCLTVTVIFTTPVLTDGAIQDAEITLTAESGRSTDPAYVHVGDGNASDSDTAFADIDLAGTIIVTPDMEVGEFQDVYRGSDETLNLLVYTLLNETGGTDDFEVTASLDQVYLDAGYQIYSVQCMSTDSEPVLGDTTTCEALANDGSVQIYVVLFVPQTAPNGDLATVVLTAEAVVGTATDDGTINTRVILPILSMTKLAYGAQSAATPIGTPRPGESIWYLITVTNSGLAAATDVEVTDNLPAQVTFTSAADPDGDWEDPIVHLDGTVTATLLGDLAAGASASFWIQVIIN